MNLNEFKAWFEGFTEDMSGAPNDKQWKRIKKRVGEINDVATTYPVYIDRYYQPYQRWFGGTPQWSSAGNAVQANGNAVQMSFADAGRAEATQMAAGGTQHEQD